MNLVNFHSISNSNSSIVVRRIELAVELLLIQRWTGGPVAAVIPHVAQCGLACKPPVYRPSLIIRAEAQEIFRQHHLIL